MTCIDVFAYEGYRGDDFHSAALYSASIYSEEYTGSQEQHTGEHVENPPFFHRFAGRQ